MFQTQLESAFGVYLQARVNGRSKNYARNAALFAAINLGATYPIARMMVHFAQKRIRHGNGFGFYTE